MKIDGQCHCGQLTFEAEADPAAITVCHCTDCQMLTGSAFRANVQVPAASFVLRGDTLKSYIKTAESGNQRRHAFCGNCGTPMYATSTDAQPQAYSLRVGTITQRNRFAPPKKQIWRRSALGWVDMLAAVPASPKG